MREPKARAARPPLRDPERDAVRLVGRAPLLDDLIRRIRSEPGQAYALGGPPGIGTSRLAAAVVDHPAIASSFGPRRWIVRCEGPMRAEDLWLRLALDLGAGGPDVRRSVRETLGAGSCLVALDAPEALDEIGVEDTDLLRELAAEPAVTLLLATGPTRPGIVDPARCIRVRPLDPTESGALLRARAGPDANEQALADLARRAGGVPAALELLGRSAAEGVPVHKLRQSWEAAWATLAGAGHGEPRALEIALEVALRNPALDLAAMRLLALLAWLPGGMDHDDLQQLAPDWGLRASSALRRAGLARGDRWHSYVTASIRDLVKARHLPCVEDVVAVVEIPPELSWAPCADRPRVSDVDAPDAQPHPLPLDAERDPLALLRSLVRLCVPGVPPVGGMAPVMLLELVGRLARERGEPHLEAVCTHRLSLLRALRGDVELARGLQRQTIALLRRALEAYEREGDLGGEAACLRDLGVVTDEPDQAQSWLERALDAYARLGDAPARADVHERLAAIARARGSGADEHRHLARALWLEQDAFNRAREVDRRIEDHARRYAAPST